MKHLFTLLLLGCITLPLSAQIQQPAFLLPFWFEDAQGNRDTIWIGSDTSASSFTLNPQFGEVAITTPFDSFFEVRAVHGYESPQVWQTSKIIVERGNYYGCFTPSMTKIMIWAKYPPIRVSWDSTILASNYPCNINTFLTPNWMVFMVPNWYEMDEINCMEYRDHYYEDFEHPPYPQSFVNPLHHEFEVEGMGMQPVPGLFYTGFEYWSYPYCADLVPVNQVLPEPELHIGPNPLSDMLTLQAEAALESLQLYDIAGRLVGTWVLSGESARVPLGELANGIYWVKVRMYNGRVVVKKMTRL